MKIVLIGNFDVPFTTENDWAWSYEKLGHEVICMQENRARTEHIYRAGKDADLVHYVHTHTWQTPGLYPIGELLKKFEARGIPTISVHLDYWRGLKREGDVGSHPFWQTKFIFTADGGSDEWYRDQGINHFYLPAGVVERDCYLGTPRDSFKYDVIFVGSYNYHPEWQYRPQLIDWLTETYGDRFHRFAGDVRPHGTVRGKDLNDLYASAKVVIGDTLCLGFKHPDYFSDRIFETTGRGGFIIHPYITGIDKLFIPEREVATYKFGDFKDLKKSIDFYLGNDKLREMVRLAGHERTKRDHTYTNRVQQVLEILQQQGAIK